MGLFFIVTVIQYVRLTITSLMLLTEDVSQHVPLLPHINCMHMDNLVLQIVQMDTGQILTL